MKFIIIIALSYLVPIALLAPTNGYLVQFEQSILTQMENLKKHSKENLLELYKTELLWAPLFALIELNDFTPKPIDFDDFEIVKKSWICEDKISALHLCAWIGFEKTAQFLLDNGAPPLSRLKFDCYSMPIHLAVQKNHLPLVKLLLLESNCINGWCMDAQDSDGRTPSDLAKHHESAQSVDYLFRKKIDKVNQQALGQSTKNPSYFQLNQNGIGIFNEINVLYLDCVPEKELMNICTRIYSIPVLYMLVHFELLHFRFHKMHVSKKKMDSWVNDRGLNALHYCIKTGETKAARLLLNKGMSYKQPIKYSPKSLPIHLAIHFRRADFMDILFERWNSRAVGPNLVDSYGNTPLQLSVLEEYVPFAHYIAQHFPFMINEYTKHTKYGESTYRTALDFAQNSQIKAILKGAGGKHSLQLELDKIFPIQFDKNKDVTILQFMDKTRMKELCNKEFNIPVLFLLAYFDSLRPRVEELEVNGAIMDSWTNREGYNAMDFCAIHGSVEAARFLLKKGMTLRTQANQGSKTLPTHLAARHNQVAFLNFLASHNIFDVYAPDEKGRTPFEIAVSLRQSNVLYIFSNWAKATHSQKKFNQQIQFKTVSDFARDAIIRQHLEEAGGLIYLHMELKKNDTDIQKVMTYLKVAKIEDVAQLCQQRYELPVLFLLAIDENLRPRIAELNASGDEMDSWENIEGDNALHFSAGYGNIKAVETLLDAGMFLRQPTNNTFKFLAIHCAASFNQVELIRFLVEQYNRHGDDYVGIGAEDGIGSTPLQIAEYYKHQKSADYIIEYFKEKSGDCTYCEDSSKRRKLNS